MFLERMKEKPFIPAVRRDAEIKVTRKHVETESQETSKRKTWIGEPCVLAEAAPPQLCRSVCSANKQPTESPLKDEISMFSHLIA